MSMIFDEYGRPFIILREQQAQARIRGKEAQKVRTFKNPCTEISGRLVALCLSLFFPCPSRSLRPSRCRAVSQNNDSVQRHAHHFDPLQQ